MATQRILIIDDEPDFRFILERVLSSEGYKVESAGDGPAGIALFTSTKPDLVLVDRIMPGIDGIEVVRAIRKIDNKVPMIFLTSKVQEDEVIEGFEAGANDYVRKPFSMKELLARVNAFLRVSVENDESVFQLGEYEIDSVRNIISHKGTETFLPAMEMKLLTLLAQNKNKTIKTDYIISRLWEDERDFYTNSNLHVYIHKIRKILENDPSIQIINERSIGYKLTIL